MAQSTWLIQNIALLELNGCIVHLKKWREPFHAQCDAISTSILYDIN